MAEGDKPYRVYRGGRVKGKVPLASRQAAARAASGGRAGARPGQHARRKRRWGRWIGIALLTIVIVAGAWLLASYFALRGASAEANDRLSDQAESALRSGGSLIGGSSNILVLGTDHSAVRGDGFSRSDSIMLIRVDASRNRIAYLSIPRDLRVEVPGHGSDRINSAFQTGGAKRAIETVSNYTGLPVHHVIVVDFDDFKELIDALGGITVDVPAPILSNRFDCPYPTTDQCLRWPGWRFEKGPNHMDGRRALVYSRIRENQLNGGDTDIARGARQQQVVQAVLSKISSLGTMARMPFVADSIMKPLATDLSAGELMQLGIAKLRARKVLNCRLGGEPQVIGGASVLVPVEENFAVVHMVEGTEAPQPPTSFSLYAPGCGTRSESDRG